MLHLAEMGMSVAPIEHHWMCAVADVWTWREPAFMAGILPMC
jgi:hypothetical protein